MCKRHGSQYGQNEWRLPPGESDIAIDSSNSAHCHARFRQRWKDDCSLPAQVRSIRQHGSFHFFFFESRKNKVITKTVVILLQVPTIGFNCEKIRALSGKAKGTQFLVWDVGKENISYYSNLKPL